MIRFQIFFALSLFLTLIGSKSQSTLMAETLSLKLSSLTQRKATPTQLERTTREVAWSGPQTAVIVCDVWDFHHCLNAVRRLEEFAPRLNQVLQAARTRGAIIIHAPSDCMEAYQNHPARQRALQTPKANPLPPGIEHWCSQLPQEVAGRYPVDQSDGGEDDAPAEHRAWADKLKALGRNPGMPWKKQSDLITIDSDSDYISDRGDEVWNILEQRGIKNVILTGVHCNMCVLGRPFGLRQMVRQGKNVVLMRDMTDSMYSPRSWPYVDHVTGHELVLNYVEQYICPTITSDQLLGGVPFQWKARKTEAPHTLNPQTPEADPAKQWTSITNAIDPQKWTPSQKDSRWYRGALFFPTEWLNEKDVRLTFSTEAKLQVWVNGRELQPVVITGSEADARMAFAIPTDLINVNDYQLVVVKTDRHPESVKADPGMQVVTQKQSRTITGGWQLRFGNETRFSNIPLPAKFGIGPDAVLNVQNPMDASGKP